MKPVIAHVITGLNTGGAEMMLSRLVARHEQSAFQPIVYCLTDEGPVADQIRALGIPVHNLGLRRDAPNPLVIATLARRLRRERVEVVQTWLYQADLIGGLAARLARIPVAWGIHNSRLDGDAVGRNLALAIQACRAVSRVVPNCIVCCAEAARIVHAEMGYPRDRMTVIPNGFELDQFRANPAARIRIPSELGIGPEEPVVLIAGRFVPLKNHRLFVEAAGIVANCAPNAHFVMVGEGLDTANPELATWIAATSHQTRFHPLGRRMDMADLLSATDIVALTSRTEAFPLVIGEAMATGVPCVSTFVGDARQLIGETGRIVPVPDAHAFAAALAELIAMPRELRCALGQRARARMEAEFDISIIAERYDRLWQQLAQGERSCG
jgi:glycosyltransferase involved in cell wall biosynthesis